MASYDSDHDLDTDPLYPSSHSGSSRFARYSRPLIDSVRNGWQSNSSPSYHPVSPEHEHYPRWVQMGLSVVAAPRFRRYVLIYFTLFLMGWLGWSVIVFPQLEERKDLLHSLDPASKNNAGGWFGTNSLPQFDDLVQIHTLDPKFLPVAPLEGGESDWKSKRLIVVGDVHGCKDERTFPYRVHLR